jgi:hypothetical protein
MSYCRFRNTLKDLQDCYENMEEVLEEYCDEEKRAREKLIELCDDIAYEYKNFKFKRFDDKD